MAPPVRHARRTWTRRLFFGRRFGLTADTHDDLVDWPAIFAGLTAAGVFGGTHQSRLEEIGGVLFVNPGSPSLAKQRTAAVLMVDGGRVSAEIVDIG